MHDINKTEVIQQNLFSQRYLQILNKVKVIKILFFLIKPYLPADECQKACKYRHSNLNNCLKVTIKIN